jgi:hypothetical protein
MITSHSHRGQKLKYKPHKTRNYKLDGATAVTTEGTNNSSALNKQHPKVEGGKKQ